MHRRTIVLPLAAVAVAAAVTPALAGSDAATPAAHAARAHTVRFGEYFYKPKTLTIHAGDRVRFVNVGKIVHTVADSTRSGTIRSSVIRPRPLKHGKSQTVTFRRAGTVYYLCTFHPTLMKGRVIVRP